MDKCPHCYCTYVNGKCSCNFENFNEWMWHQSENNALKGLEERHYLTKGGTDHRLLLVESLSGYGWRYYCSCGMWGTTNSLLDRGYHYDELITPGGPVTTSPGWRTQNNWEGG
jgi:hypothetical protein